MGYGANPNDSDFTIVTVVLQYGVFATLCPPFNKLNFHYLYKQKSGQSVQHQSVLPMSLLSYFGFFARRKNHSTQIPQ